MREDEEAGVVEKGIKIEVKVLKKVDRDEQRGEDEVRGWHCNRRDGVHLTSSLILIILFILSSPYTA